jgi:GNAT superfamily N-acetyltransferase
MHVRRMQLTDVMEVTALSEQLGYPTTRGEVERRFLAITNDTGHGLFVAESQQEGGSVLGWVHIFGVPLLETDGYAEIGGLVVHAQARRQGAGRALLQAAEQWAQERNYTNVRLGSGTHRTEAHAFYDHMGYSLMKTAKRFRKSLKRDRSVSS